MNRCTLTYGANGERSTTTTTRDREGRVILIENAAGGPAAGVHEFGASGGATQYRFDLPVEELVRRGYLEVLP